MLYSVYRISIELDIDCGGTFVVSSLSGVYEEVLSSACEEILITIYGVSGLYTCVEDVALDVEKMEGVSMKEQIWEYVVGLYKDIPSGVYEGLAVVLCIGVVSLMVAYGGRKGARLSTGLLLTEYVFVLYSSTVIFRATSERFSGYDLHPFWSYRAYFSGEAPQLLVENVMNVVVFVPVGILLGGAIRQMTWLKALLIGVGISASIEVMQLMLKRGFCEVDDVMHNTVGCVIGYGVWMVCRYLFVPQRRPEGYYDL